MGLLQAPPLAGSLVQRRGLRVHLRRRTRHFDPAFGLAHSIARRTWENVWGVWNGIVPRDGEAIKRVAKMLRFFGGPGGLLQSGGEGGAWDPHSVDVLTPNVYASRWSNATQSSWLKATFYPYYDPARGHRGIGLPGASYLRLARADPKAHPKQLRSSGHRRLASGRPKMNIPYF